MKTITIEELEALKDAEKTIVDIRPQDQYMRGTFPGAVSLPASRLEEQYEEETARLDKMHPVYVMCHTGEKSQEWVRRLTGDGFDAVNVEGGYRAWLRLSLSRFVGGESEADREEKRARIEQSIIKKFRKPIWRAFTRALNTYDLIQEGDKIAVCISGGKDSMLMAKLLQLLQRHSDVPFEIVNLVMDPGYNAVNRQKIESNAALLHIPVTSFETNIFDVTSGIEQSPCYLCARMRRGYLYSKARELGCNKIALGHHFSDVVETTVMGMFYGSQLQAMPPKLRSRNFPGMELIRPMYCIHEDDIIAWQRYNGLEFIQCACRFTERAAAHGNDGSSSKRQEVKLLLRELRRKNPDIEKSIFHSIHSVCLDTMVGYKSSGVEHTFVDCYRERGQMQEDAE